MEIPAAPEGYRYKLVKKGLTEAQKRAMLKYREKNKEKLQEYQRNHNKKRYNDDLEYKTKTRQRCKETHQNKKQIPEIKL
jgi:hypothetical protein